VRKPTGKRPLGRPRCGWEDDIKINLGKTEWGCMEWIDLSQDMNYWWNVVNTVMNIRVQ
jgi:hypothetical protein